MTRRIRRPLTALLAGALLLPFLGAGAAAANPIDAKRAEAARIATRLAALGEKQSVIDEQFNQARLRLARADARVAAAKARAAETEQRLRRARAAARARAVAAYVDGRSLTQVAAVAGGPGDQLTLRHEYLSVAASDDRQALDRLQAARGDLAAEQASLDKERADARSAAAKVASARADAAKAVDEQRRLLSQVNGELSQLVAAEQARQAAAAAAKAKAALASRQAREQAAAAAAKAGATGGSRASRSQGPTPDGVGTGGSTNGPPPASGASAAVEFARRQIGKPYEYGAAGPDSYDCSGLTMSAWRAGGRSLSHSSSAQYGEVTHVSMSQLEPGDLLFYGSPIHHVGIYVGGGQMIEAPHSGTVVRYASIYRSDFVGAGRP